MTFSILLMAATPAHAEPLKVVASTPFFADLVRQVGGERVEVKSVASPKFNIHFIQPRPSDVRGVAKADLFVFTGLDLEAWADPLLKAAGKPELFRGGARNVDLSSGIPLTKIPQGNLSRALGDLHLFGNPHYAMDPENLKIMAATLVGKLKEADPSGALEYDRRASEFLSKLDAKIGEWRAACAHCAGKEIVSYHDDIDYFARFLGLKAEQFVEPKPGIPPTPKHTVFLEDYMKSRGIKAIVMPTYYPRGSADAVAAKTGAKVVLIAQNAGELPGTEDVFGFFDVNVRAMADALR